MLYRTIRLSPALLLAALLASTPLYAAKLYKWTDEEGNVHYSQKPASATGTEEVIHAQPEEVEEAVEETAPIEVPVPVDTEAAQKQAERCQSLLRDLEIYQSSEQVTDSEGNVIEISPEMRDAKLKEINEELDRSCR
jgi:hypothetical protein